MPFIVSNSFATPLAFVSSSENASFPMTNLADYTHPNRPFKSTELVSGTTYVGLNFGVATALAALVLDNINLTAVKIGHSSNGSSWTDTDATVTVAQDGADGRYKAYIALTAWNYQYVRVLANTGTATDNTAVLRLGGIAALTSVTTLTENPSGNYDRMPLQATDLNDDFSSGIAEPTRMGERYCEIGLNGPTQRNSTAVTSDFLTLIGGYAKHIPFVFYRNTGNPEEVYILRRWADVALSLQGPNKLSFSGLRLRECA